MRELGIAIPTMDREDMTFASFADLVGDARVTDVAIVDGSTQAVFDRMALRAAGLPGVRLTQNVPHAGPYVSKRAAVAFSNAPWIILLDSDNTITRAYVDTLFALPQWHPDTLYVPVVGAPSLDYRAFSGLTVDRHNNIHDFLDQPSFLVALNTGNFFVHRASYLAATLDGDASWFITDCFYFTYRWLASGQNIHFTPDLAYTHRVHAGHWMQHAQQIIPCVAALTQKMRDGDWNA